MTAPKSPSNRPPTAIGKVAAVVEVLAEARRTTEIARRTGLPTSTVHRILQELVELGWAREDGVHGYLLGARLLSLAARATDETLLADLARPVVRALANRSGLAVHCAARIGDEAVYIDKAEGRGSYLMRSRIGATLPLHSTGIGKAMLATASDIEVRALLARTGMPARTGRTLTEPEVFVEHLAGIRARGYAIDDEENEEDIRCVAVAVLDHRGAAVGGLSMSALAFDLDEERVRRLAPLVVRAGQTLTAALGGAQ